jgi:hypothetical protein
MKDIVQQFIVTFAAVVVGLFLFFALTNVAVAQTTVTGKVASESITARDVLAAEKVLAETRTMRQIIGGAGATFGAYVGYTAAVAAGLSPVGTVALATSGAVIYGTSMYGGATAGLEFAVSNEANKIKAQIAAAQAQSPMLSDLEKKKESIQKWFKEL